MNTTMQKIEAMPADVQREVLDFARFLMSRKKPQRQNKPLKQDWAGALREYKGRFTSLDLQEKANEWRG
jgi:hypothetical protein